MSKTKNTVNYNGKTYDVESFYTFNNRKRFYLKGIKDAVSENLLDKITKQQIPE